MELEEFQRALEDRDFAPGDSFWLDGIEFEVVKIKRPEEFCTTNSLKSLRLPELNKMPLEDELMQFTGTEQYYRNFTGLLFTDGIKYLADKAKCYWLIDLVGSYQPRLGNAPFQLWQLKVNDDKSALVTMVEDTGLPVKIRQAIPYTDFPLKDFSFYCVDKVMMLKSEY